MYSQIARNRTKNKTTNKTMLRLHTLIIVISLYIASFSTYALDWSISEQAISARHESGLVAVGNKMYLIGGRGDKPLEIFDTGSATWSVAKAKNPMELHHFQALSIVDKIYIMGAFTGGFPDETPIPKVLIFDTQTNTWQTGATIPKKRQRGAASLAIYQDHIYMVGGSTQGHLGGFTKWFDRFNPVTKEFTGLPDAPHSRDHAQAAVVGDYLYHFGGRQTSHATGDIFNLTVAEVDRFNFKTQTWETLPNSANLPTPRAGGNTAVVGDFILYIGGESAVQKLAHNEVEAFNTKTLTWHTLPSLNTGRHSGGATIVSDALYAVTGSGNRGGRPELPNHEMIPLSKVKSLLQDISLSKSE